MVACSLIPSVLVYGLGMRQSYCVYSLSGKWLTNSMGGGGEGVRQTV